MALVSDHKRELLAFAEGIEARLNYKRPWAFALGAIRFDADDEIVEAFFPHINIEEDFVAAAVFSNVAHHRFGNKAYRLSGADLCDINTPLWSFRGEPGHPNVEACQLVQKKVTDKAWQAYAVFITDPQDMTEISDAVVHFFRELAYAKINGATRIGVVTKR